MPTEPRGNRSSGRRRPAPARRGDGRSGKGPNPRTATPPAPIDPARTAARDVLRAVRRDDAYANLLLPRLLRERRITERDAAFATELTYGASRTLGLLDAIISSAADRPIDAIDGDVLDLLRLGAYQLLRTRVATHAAVATTVDMAREEFGSGRAGFVNAVLRRVSEVDEDGWIARLQPDAAADPIGNLAFRHAHPEWIAQAFADALGERAGELPDLLAADNARPELHLVARPGAITAEELALSTGGEVGPYSPYAVHLDGAGDPGRIDAVRDRMASVQDEGSQLVVLALERAQLVGPDGGRWLDLCAGPGGKAALLGALADIEGARVDAVEPSTHRAELVRTAVDGLPVEVHVVDGRDSGLDPGYDRVLVDAPCTGLGALRRRPEARWRRTEEDLRDLTRLQRELLAAAVDLVRPGGVIAYSTCSPHLSETMRITADATRRFGLEPLDTAGALAEVPDAGAFGGAAQLWPHRHGTDGMFVALLRKPV